jgi:hypothetical protein
MKAVRGAWHAAMLAGFTLVLAATACAQSTPDGAAPSNTPAASTPSAQPGPGATSVAAETPAAAATATDPPAPNPKDKPVPGAAPVGGDTPAATVKTEKVIEPGSQMIRVK